MASMRHAHKDANSGDLNENDQGKSVYLKMDSNGLKSNWVMWHPVAMRKLTIIFGEQASHLMKTGKQFVHSKTAEESRPKGKHSPELIHSFDKQFWKIRLEDISSMEKNKEKLMFSFINLLAEPSQDLIMTHDQYQLAIDESDPVRMYKIIKEMHLTKIGGTSESKKALGRQDIMDQWAVFRQSADMELVDYHRKFKEWLSVLAAWDVTTLTDIEQGYAFVKRLDPVRYNTMLRHFKNISIINPMYPATLFAAFTVANGWEVEGDDQPNAKQSASGEPHQRSFMARDIIKQPATQVTGGGRGRLPKRVPGVTLPGDELLNCFNCGELGHVSCCCSKPKRPKQARPRGGDRKAPKDPKPAADAVPEAQQPAGPAAGPQRRPTAAAVETGLLARGEYDGEDDSTEASDRSTFLVRNGVRFKGLYTMAAHLPSVSFVSLCSEVVSAVVLVCKLVGTLIYNLLTGWDYEVQERAVRVALLAKAGVVDVILDSAASHSLFHNALLLSGLTNMSRPYIMKGVERGSVGINVSQQGVFCDLGTVHFAVDAVANILSHGELVDNGFRITLDNDEFVVHGPDNKWIFSRKLMRNGKKTRFYTCEFQAFHPEEDTLSLPTVAEAQRGFTVRERQQAEDAVELAARMGNMSHPELIATLNRGGILNCPTTAADVRNAEQMFGPSVQRLMGSTKKQAPMAASREIPPRVAQPEQVLSIDIMFVKGLEFLVGVLSPLELCVGMFLPDRSAPTIAKGINTFIATAQSRNFDVVRVDSDGEGGVFKMRDELAAKGVVVDACGPGQHKPVVERKIQPVKERTRGLWNGLAYCMNRKLLIAAVMFAIWSLNNQVSATSIDQVSPAEQFTGRKLDLKRDLRARFGEWCHATVPVTDNTMSPRTESCIFLGSAGNLTGSAKMYNIETGQVVIRDQFKTLPITDAIAARLTASARADGLQRNVSGIPESTERFDSASWSAEIEDYGVPRSNESTSNAIDTDAGVHGTQSSAVPNSPATPKYDEGELRRSSRSNLGAEPERLTFYSQDVAQYLMTDDARSAIRQQLVHRANYHDEKFAFKMSVRAAMRDRPEEARPVILAELWQMIEKGVWRAIHTSSLSTSARNAIIRSSMFLKDKYDAAGRFLKFKARLVAGGDQPDKSLYDTLSSPTAATSSVLTAATSSVLTVAAIAAAEWRHVMTIDIGGAFLNADMAPTGVLVHMRLDPLLTQMLLELRPEYRPFVEPSGCMVVELDKALYGCVEASALWFANLRDKLLADGFEQNPYDMCIFNKFNTDGSQITIALHVDDLLVTSTNEAALLAFDQYLKSVYPQTESHYGDVLDYLGMSFDFRVRGEVSVTMANCVNDILSECGVDTARRTPATEHLFDVRDTTKASEDEREWFHSYVAKVLYLAKRVRPECLTTVAFLSTRVNDCDVDDLAKLRRLLGYILGTSERGITLRIGDKMSVSAYIDAAYGVHSASGKSHTGCSIVLGDAGPVLAKSSKQKCVTKSSTEAELVGLSDTASLAIHMRNFVLAQGYEVGPAVIYQDNLSCMALMKRGGPTSERSRHIEIRHFWLKEKVDGKQVTIEHLGTEKMFANVLTKPVQGEQFEKERRGLTNWVGVH